MTLSGRFALVTGASRGIGATVAAHLAREGARLMLVARSADALERVARDLPGGALTVAADLADPTGVAAVVEAVQRDAPGGAPDILILNAGAFALGRVGELPLAQADAMIDLNLRAPYQLLHRFLPVMRARGTGHVVSVGSVADHVAFPENGAYAMTKFGARGLHEVLRAELAGSGIRTTLVSPGPVDTPIWDPWHPEQRPGFPPRSAMLHASDVAEAVLWAVTRAPHVNVDEVRLSRS